MIELQGSAIIHITFVSPTGAMSQVETPVSLDDLVEFIRAKLQEVKPCDASASS